MDFDYLKILVTISLAVLGWLVGHYFNTRRTLTSKRRAITLEHLISSYRILTNEILHRDLDKDRRKKLEDLLSDIQLFGSSEQVNFARSLIAQVVAGGTFELDPLINSLRDDLRLELRLAPIDGNVKWMRFDNNSPDADKH